LDSASLNYPGTDTLVPAIELAEICVIIEAGSPFFDITAQQKIQSQLTFLPTKICWY
jgi:hypothetical protein